MVPAPMPRCAIAVMDVQRRATGCAASFASSTATVAIPSRVALVGSFRGVDCWDLPDRVSRVRSAEPVSTRRRLSASPMLSASLMLLRGHESRGMRTLVASGGSPSDVLLRRPSAVIGLRYLSGGGNNANAVRQQEDDADEHDAEGRARRERGVVARGDLVDASAAREAAEAERKLREDEEAKQRIKKLAAARERARNVLYGETRSPMEIASGIASSIMSGVRYILVSTFKMAMYSPSQWQSTLSGWWATIKHEAHHYWVGTKLLAVDVRIASGLLIKVIRGTQLTRREKKQLTRTTSDIFRLVPFAIFVIVPLGELLLPFALRVFPNMLPSTFEDKVKKDEELKKKLQAKIAIAKFLQETLTEMAGDLRDSRSGEVRASAENLYEFMKKVRAGEKLSQKEMLSHAKLFNDELTLDSLTRQQLNGMTYILGLSSTSGFLSDDILRIKIRKQLRELKEDDFLIQQEGVDSLDEDELKAACRGRGIRAQYGQGAKERMRKGLSEWLDMSLKRNLPSSLLVLTSVFRLTESVLESSEKEKTEDEILQRTLSTLPPVGVSFNVQSGAAAKERELEYVLHQQQLIEEEERQQKVMAEKEQKEKESFMENPLLLVDESDEEAAVKKQGKMSSDMDAKLRLEEQQQLAEVAQALSVLASSSAVCNERAELMGLVQKEIDAYNARYAPGSQLLFDASEGSGYVAGVREEQESGPEMALSMKVDSMLSALNDELSQVEEKIGKNIKVLDADGDGRVTPEEISSALSTLKNKLDDNLVREAIFDRLNLDTEGTVRVEQVLDSLRKTTEMEVDDEIMRAK